MAYYRDFREYLKTLEENEKLFRVKREVSCLTELQPLVRWQFRGLPEEQRRAFLFENVTDGKGKRYNMSVAVAAFAASKSVYALGMQCKPEEIFEKWTAAQLNPIKPKMVKGGPVHEVVYMGEELNREGGGMDIFPIPLSTPGFGTPRLTASHWLSKDPDTGKRNIGHYSAMLHHRNRLICLVKAPQHLGTHWEMCKEKGIPLQAAIILGPPPNVAYTAVAKLPYDVDEYDVSGGLSGEPLELVKCKTVDLEVPATAEIVIEGEISTEYVETVSCFGEYCGYMSQGFQAPPFQITCITHRKDPIFPAFISQFPPSESSMIRKMAYEPLFYKMIKYDCNNPTVLDVAIHEESGSALFVVIKIKKTHPAQPSQVLNAASALDSQIGKIFVVVDEDIDPGNIDAVIWAMLYRMQPHRDMRVIMGRTPFLDSSAAPPDTKDSHLTFPMPSGASALLIDATRKWDYPPISLPKKEYMERARKIWEEEGLPPLTPKEPWYGYSLGLWSKQDEEDAEMALKGEYYKVGERHLKERTKVR